MSNTELRHKDHQDTNISREKAKKMADTLKYQETILSRHSGDLYRIASIIVDNTFSDDAIVNPVNNSYDVNNKKDIVNMGIFEVAERKNKEYQSSLS